MKLAPLALAVAASSCGRGAIWGSPARARIEVRMERTGEYRMRNVCTPFSEPGCVDTSSACPIEGESAPELVDALAAYSRANLVGELDGFTGYRTAEIEVSIEQHDGNHRHADGLLTKIVIQPRTRTGQVMVSQSEISGGQSRWGAYLVYCAHVVPGPVTTIILEKLGGMIG